MYLYSHALRKEAIMCNKRSLVRVSAGHYGVKNGQVSHTYG